MCLHLPRLIIGPAERGLCLYVMPLLKPNQPEEALPTRTKISTRAKGQHAEQIAVRHLKDKGYRIIDRNFVCKLGEIDIIATHQGDLVFVEVRSRHSALGLDPAYSIDTRKQNKIIKTAQVYLERCFPRTPTARFDVVLVTLAEPTQVEIIPDAFRVEDSRF